MRTLAATLLISFLAPIAIAQDTTPAAPAAAINPLTAHGKSLYSGTRQIVLRSAERMPSENYSFKPVDSVRTFAQILGHVADSQYGFCSVVLGEKNTTPKVDTAKKTKAELIAALNDAFAYCDRAYASLTDATGAEAIRFMGGDRPRLGVLNINTVHTIEHYGNLVTYLRINDIVPPTSEPEFMKQISK